MKNLIALKKNKGFTIVETLVAVAILMISIAGPLTIAQKGLTAAVYARDQVTASFLAQDAMEYIKNIRDNNILDEDPWLRYIIDNGCSSASNQCKVDTTSSVQASAIQPCNGNCYLYLSDRGYDTNSSGTKTQFTRSFYVDITNISNPDEEATVYVTVSWTNGTIANAVTLENQLFNISR